jgi:hypothetical protein
MALLHQQDAVLLDGSFSRLGEAFVIAISFPLYIHLDMRNSVPRVRRNLAADQSQPRRGNPTGYDNGSSTSIGGLATTLFYSPCAIRIACLITLFGLGWCNV